MRHGERSAATLATLRELSAYLRLLRDGSKALQARADDAPCGEDLRIINPVV